ncbi:MAG: hypothetical protein H7Y12_09090 [Sphingobacteriaceae bacterium]|nr:hypothetical protein [Cytophagaceae bacterium]
MNTRNLLSIVLWSLLYLALQVLLFRNLALFHYGFCFVYVAVILSLPFDVSVVTTLFMAFAAGFIVDIFYNTPGLHAAATVLVAYLRPFAIRLLMPQRGYEERNEPLLTDLGPAWFLSYVGLLVLVHHSVVFFIEAANWNLWLPTLGKIGLSTVFTTVVLTLLQVFRRN